MGCGCLNKKKVEIISNIKDTKNNENNHNHSISINANNDSNNNNSNQNNILNHNNNERNNLNNNNNNNLASNNDSISENNQNNQIQRNNNNNNINQEVNLINSRENNLIEINNLNINPSYEPYLQSKHDENFNYKEVDQYVGEGVKKMKGYICPVSFEELEKIRKDFWSSRIEGNPIIWEVLHTICSDNNLSQEDINVYMRSSNIITYKGCINVTYDNKGYLYEIPNYCINDPVEYEKKEDKLKPDEKEIEIKIRCFSDEKKIKINNYKYIKDLKEVIKTDDFFCDKFILDNLRLFFGGKELLDMKEIWFYNIESESIVQMLANPLKNKLKIEENQNLKNSNVLSDIILNSEKGNDNNNKEIEVDESDNFQETLTEQNKLLIKINK